MSKTLSVSYEGKHCYDIQIRSDFEQLVPFLQELGYQKERRVCVITDSNVAPLYLEEVSSRLKEAFSVCTSFVFPAGEAHKNTDTVGNVYTHLIEHKFDRRDFLIALGGGVVGDLTGFAAATYLRGIDFVQVPTTLLAQVDSSIGGKTGVDFMQYKNMVGAFYMPRMVYMNLKTLETLPQEQYASGMGEILKHGQIKDRDYFDRTAWDHEAIQNRVLPVVEEMVYESCRIKRDVVQRDPKEQGERALLNFGHTVGHAIEKLSNFKLMHGQCVALGMVSAGYLSWEYGSYSEEDFRQLEETLAHFCLPIRLADQDFTAEDVLRATRLDKKMEAGRIKFILLNCPGESYITRELTDAQILEGISYLWDKK